MKRGQISTEYLILIGFITFVIIGVLGVAFFYTNAVKDDIRFKQIQQFSEKIISSAESVFYSGEPSKITVTSYLPEGVNSIQIVGKEIIMNISTSSGQNIISYPSRVNLQGAISANSGIKKIEITAQEDRVIISQN